MKIVRLPATLWLAVAGYGALAQPEIRIQPADASVSPGATAQFTASANTTTPPITYQWWFNDTALDPVANPSAARARLSLTNVTLGNAGSYSVVISDASGSIKSRMATLDVDPQFTKLTQGPVVTDPVRGMSGKFGDYDGDGRLDLAFMGNYWHVGNNARLYHNEGNGQFSTVTTSPWGSLSDRVSFSAWADTDNDGDLDLFLAANENDPPVFLRNDGGGAFTRFTVDKSWTSNEVLIRGGTSAWGDFDNDGFLDAVVGNGSTTHLLHNSRDGTFTRLTGGSSDLGGPGWTDTFDWVDYDHDGDLDLFVAKEDALSRLYRNDGLSRFTDVTLTVLQGRVGQGFGGAWGDYDNDGDMDLIFVGREGPGRFLINDGDGTFSDWSGSPHAMLSVANGLPVWGDYDNDGHLDLLITQYGSHSRLFRSLGDGCFVEVTVGSLVNDPTPGSMNPAEPSVITAAWADYDNDGDLDVFVACDQSTGNYLYENNGNGNHWLKLRLHGTVSNRSAVGARVSVQAAIGGKSSRQLRQVTAQSAVQELEAHFGLGDATMAEVVRVEWPSGNVQELTDQDVDRVLKITEPIRIQPPRPSASLGGAVTLNGLGTGTYQWQFNGVDLAGETKRTLTLTNLQAAQQGRYSLVVTAADDTRRVTNHAYLTIDTQFTKITEGATATERGCSWISSCGDYDNDGNPDLAVLRYPASQSAVYRNNGDGTFTTVPDIPWNTGQGYSWGLWGDFDNDGHQDFVSQRANQPASIYFGDGHGTFTARELQLGESWSIAVADYDQDGFLDLYGSYSSHLLRNNGDRTFTRMTSQQACRLPTTSTWGGALWADYDDDGAQDLFCANNGGSTYLYHNNGPGCFTAVSSPVIGGSAIAGAWGDYDNDGRLDLCPASLQGIRDIYRNLGENRFEPAKTGVTIQGVHNSAVWMDYDNDGWLDLFLTGHKNALYRNLGNGTLSQVHIGSIAAESPAAGASTYNGLWFDYDNDGFLDVYITAGDDYGSTRTPSFLYRNNGNSNTWLRIKLVGTVSNRDGVGVKVRVRAVFANRVHWQRRDISGGDVYNGHQLIAHFGLGNAVQANLVRIEWPSGTVQELRNVPVNQMLTVTEPPALEALGEGRLRLLCWKRQNYELEVSDDLGTWTSLGVVATDVNRPVVLDPGAAQRPYRFYRTKGL